MKKLTLTPTQTKLVTSLVRASTSPQSVVQRGSLILDSAESGKMSWVASKHGVGRDTVRRWYQRWQTCQRELDQLEAEYQAGTMSETRYRREIETLLCDAKRPDGGSVSDAGDMKLWLEEKIRALLKEA